jgi:hypothetical protein
LYLSDFLVKRLNPEKKHSIEDYGEDLLGPTDDKAAPVEEWKGTRQIMLAVAPCVGALGSIRAIHRFLSKMIDQEGS